MTNLTRVVVVVVVVVQLDIMTAILCVSKRILRTGNRTN